MSVKTLESEEKKMGNKVEIELPEGWEIDDADAPQFLWVTPVRKIDPARAEQQRRPPTQWAPAGAEQP